MSKSLDRIWKDFQGFLTRAHEFILTKESSPLSGGFSSVLTCSYTWFDFCIRNELVLKVNKLTFFYQVKKNDIVLLPFKLRRAEKQIKNSADVKRSPQILERMHSRAIFFSFVCPVSYLFWIFSSCLGILWECQWYVCGFMLYILVYAGWSFSLERSEGWVGFQQEHVLVQRTFQESLDKVSCTTGECWYFWLEKSKYGLHPWSIWHMQGIGELGAGWRQVWGPWMPDWETWTREAFIMGVQSVSSVDNWHFSFPS